MLHCRVCYFTDGAVIGNKEFVNEAFTSARDRFDTRRKDGARTMKGSGKGTKGLLWSARDLRVRICASGFDRGDGLANRSPFRLNFAGELLLTGHCPDAVWIRNLAIRDSLATFPSMRNLHYTL